MIVCLCGSTRFRREFEEVNRSETFAGNIVLTVGVFKEALTYEQHSMLDRLHLKKIDMADEVIIINVGGYMGDGTIRELAYAQKEGKRIRFLEPKTEEQISCQ